MRNARRIVYGSFYGWGMGTLAAMNAALWLAGVPGPWPFFAGAFGMFTFLRWTYEGDR